MASSDYNYDEKNTHAPFFLLTMVGLVTLPLTYNILKPSTDLENTATRIDSEFKPKDDAIIQAQRRRQKVKERKTKRIITVILGYIFMAYMLYLIVTTQRVIPKLWDPYDILGVSRSATEKEIDRFYKRQSLKFHPDKARPDPSKNETLETINDRWVEMTKAYKALTDAEIRNNYLMYGNPDGKQSTSIGIAIPKWVVEEGNRPFVILFYAGLLGVFLPYAVGKWWYGTQALTKDKVLHASAGSLFREWKEEVTESDVIAALSVGDEFQEVFKGVKGEHGASRVETKVLKSGLLSDKDTAKLKEVDDPVRRKTLALLWAYLGRVDLADEELEKQKYEVAPVARLLNQSFSSITLPFLLVDPLMSSYHASQSLVQAMTPGSSPILQLPHFTPSIAKKISGSSSKSVLSLQKLMSLPPSIRRSLCSDLSDTQYKEAMHVASQIPNVHVEKAFFKVPGDRYVTPGSLVQLVVKFRIVPLGTKDVPAVDPLDLEDIDPDETDVDAIAGRKPAKNRARKTPDGKVIEDDSKEDSVQPPLAHAPYYGADHSPRWHVFLADPKANRIAVPPFTFTAFDRPIFDAQGKPTFNIQTWRCQFVSPPQVHAFPFQMHLVCDSYVGFDAKVDVVLDVRDVSETNAVIEEDDISEPDEDSLAGQLAAMKSGTLSAASSPKNKKTTKRLANHDSDDDESDTDGDVSDTSETDTETEDES